MPTLQVIDRDPAALKPRDRNPRTHSKKQIRQIARSIERFGFKNPVLIDQDGGIVAGHGRVEAAKLLGLTTIPTIALEGMSEAELKAYVIADNKLAELAGWDRQTLALELQGLLDLDLNFDVSVTGFEPPEIDILFAEVDQANDDPAEEDEAPEVSAAPPVSRLGDLWLIGPHRLYCGDATQESSYTALLGAERARMVFTDPPYNVPINGHVSGLGKVKHREFAMATGEMSKAQFTTFLRIVFEHLAALSVNGAIQFVCMDWRHMEEVLTAGRDAYTELKNLCVRANASGGMGSLYRSQHELVFVYKAGREPHVNNVRLGSFGRNRTNVWRYPGVNSFGKNRDAELALHPTVKPVALIRDAILDCSNRNDIVLDAFAGSGSTLLAAAKAGRRGYAIEFDPRYCDIILQRLRKETKLDARLSGSDQTFEAVAAERAAANSNERREAAA